MKNTLAALRKIAESHPGVTRDIACKGTPLESATFKAAKKAFLFVQLKDGAWIVRLKLGASAKEAKKRGYEVGANGWTKIPLEGEPPKFLAKWIAESYAAVSS